MALCCSVIMSVLSVLMSLWFFAVNDRVNAAIDMREPLSGIPNLTFWEVHMYAYSSFGAGGCIVFTLTSLQLGHPGVRLKWPPAALWWISMLVFVAYLPTVLFPISAMGIWAMARIGPKGFHPRVSDRVVDSSL
jgi:hypothetical protein